MAAKYQGRHVRSNIDPIEPLQSAEPDALDEFDEPAEIEEFEDSPLDDLDELDGYDDSPIDESRNPQFFDSQFDDFGEAQSEDSPFEAPAYAPIVSAADGAKDGKRKKQKKGSSKSKGKGKKGKAKKSSVGTALLVIGLVLLAAAIALGIYLAKDYISARMKYNDLREAAGNLEVFDEVFNGEKELFDINIDWDSLKAKNPDIVGWIYVENTNINYPICQAKDNEYYLSHNADGNYSSSGAIFLDYENKLDMSSDVNFIYGHNMMDGSMFANITKFKKQSFLDKNNRIIIVTPEHAWILGCAFTYIADGGEKIRKTDFNTPEEMHEYIQKLLDERAVTSSLVDVNEIGKMFCLVTCSYEKDDVRTVLCAVEQKAIDFPKS